MIDYFNKKKDIKMEGIPLPRVRGNAFKLPTERWSYEMELTIGQEPPMCIGTKETHEGWETKEEAVKEMKEIATGLLREVCLAMGVTPEGWLDLNKNELVQELK